jgi:hypothetical protein
MSFASADVRGVARRKISTSYPAIVPIGMDERRTSVKTATF